MSVKVNNLTKIYGTQRALSDVSFEAKAGEIGVPIPDYHFDQVNLALSAFEKEFLLSHGETVTSTEKSDVLTGMARKFLRDMKSLTHQEEVKTICTLMGQLLEKGVHTPLPNEIKKLKQQLDKRQITLSQMDSLILMLAKKYDISQGNDEDVQTGNDVNEIEFGVQPDVVISETFIA